MRASCDALAVISARERPYAGRRSALSNARR